MIRPGGDLWLSCDGGRRRATRRPSSACWAPSSSTAAATSTTPSSGRTSPRPRLAVARPPPVPWPRRSRRSTARWPSCRTRSRPPPSASRARDGAGWGACYLARCCGKPAVARAAWPPGILRGLAGVGGWVVGAGTTRCRSGWPSPRCPTRTRSRPPRGSCRSSASTCKQLIGPPTDTGQHRRLRL